MKEADPYSGKILLKELKTAYNVENDLMVVFTITRKLLD
jgi:hypothetical protein